MMIMLVSVVVVVGVGVVVVFFVFAVLFVCIVLFVYHRACVADVLCTCPSPSSQIRKHLARL